jgi:hypothetical protein
MATDLAWHLSEHCCKACAGRVLASVDGERVRCADCGLSADGGPEEICFCRSLPGGSRVSLHCVTNEHRSAEFPSEIVAVEAPAETVSAARAAWQVRHDRGSGHRLRHDCRLRREILFPMRCLEIDPQHRGLCGQLGTR